MSLRNRIVAPESLAPPAANYAHAVVSESPGRILHTSGVVPIGPDGTTPESLVAQAETVWANLAAIVDDAAMVMDDIVSVTTYVVADEHDLADVMAVRDRALGGGLAASTLVTVPRLARPEWRLEIAVVAIAHAG